MINNNWDVLNTIFPNAYAVQLKNLYHKKFILQKNLTQSQKENAFMFLQVLKENKKIDKKVKDFCTLELENIFNFNSSFIEIHSILV